MSDVGIRISLDTTQAQAQAASLATSLGKVHESLEDLVKSGSLAGSTPLPSFIMPSNAPPMITPSNAPPMIPTSIMSEANSEALQRLQTKTAGIDPAEQSHRNEYMSLIMSFRDLNTATKDIIEAMKSFPSYPANPANPSGENPAEKERQEQEHSLKNPHGTLLDASSRAASVVSTLAGGDYAGAAIQGVQGASKAVYGAGVKLSEKDDSGSVMGGILSKIGVGGIIASFVGMAGNALSKQYESTLPSIDSFYTNYGKDIDKNTAEVNSAYGMEYFNRAADKNKGLNISNQDFLEYSANWGQYGVGKADRALDMTVEAASWARSKGVDKDLIQTYMGMAQRYGGEDGNAAMNNAYGALKASGMENGQLAEFMRGMEGIIEEGISKGFVRSSSEVATNLAMLSKLSGNNPLWQGEQGAKRLSQMNEGIASATSLQSTTDLLTFQAAGGVLSEAQKNNTLNKLFKGDEKYLLQGDNFINTMALMERGVSANMLEAQRNAVNNAYGNDEQSKVMAYMDMYKLNYTGGLKAYDMMNKLGTEGFTKESAEKDIKSFQTDPDYRSDSAKLQDVLNDLNKSMVNFGKDATGIKIDGLSGISGTVDGIYEFLTGKTYDKIKNAVDEKLSPLTGLNKYTNETLQGIFTSQEMNGYGKQIGKLFNDHPENWTSSINFLNNLTPEQRYQLNMSNQLNLKKEKGENDTDYERRVRGQIEKLATEGISAIKGGGDIEGYLANMPKKKSFFQTGSNWQAEYLAENLLKGGQGAQDVLDKNIMTLLGGRFDKQEDFHSFINSSNTQAFRGMYYDKFENGENFSNEKILTELKRAMQQFEPVAKIMLEAAQIQERLAQEGIDIYQG